MCVFGHSLCRYTGASIFLLLLFCLDDIGSKFSIFHSISISTETSSEMKCSLTCKMLTATSVYKIEWAPSSIGYFINQTKEILKLFC